MKPKEAESILKKHGFVEVLRGNATSHRQYWNEAKKKSATISFHRGDLTPSTLASIIRQSGIKKEDFK
jgi:predicted RNA binding protein YcfA (HicA-like mRNA interferase family)